MKEPPVTQYTVAFEKCWKAHPVGVKKAAWKAGEKAGFSDENWAWLENYLIKRHKDDIKWLEGKYVPHLSTFVNQERWTDNYKRRSMRYEQQAKVETPEEIAAAQKRDQERFEEARRQAEIRREWQRKGMK